MRVVTLEGDIHDPSGLLTGGSRTQSYSILEKVASLQGRIALLETAEMNLENITQTMNELNKKLNDKLKAEQMLDLKKHELHVFEQELTQSANGQVRSPPSYLIKSLMRCRLSCNRISSKPSYRVRWIVSVN